MPTTPQSTLVRYAHATDAAAILAINAACMPAVSEMSPKDFAGIAGWASHVQVAETDGAVVAFVILMPPGTAYPSDNYVWFSERFDRFVYVDRIAVVASARGQGVGRQLYARAAEIANAEGGGRVLAEVNEDPPNPESMAFHLAHGFRHLLSRRSRSGKVVAMLERMVAP